MVQVLGVTGSWMASRPACVTVRPGVARTTRSRPVSEASSTRTWASGMAASTVPG